MGGAEEIMMVIGLTGGIASGKSTIAERFARHGLKVLDADAAVHVLLDGAARDAIASAFPDAMHAGNIDRKALGAIVFSNPEKLTQLEAILHPLVRAAEEAFIAEQKAIGAKAAVLEIPLLFETMADSLCEVTITASAPESVRVARAMARPNMTEAKLEFVLNRQLPEEVRNRRADQTIDTSGTLEYTYAQVDKLVAQWGLIA